MVSDRMEPETGDGTMENIYLTMKRTISLSFSEHLIKCILAWCLQWKQFLKFLEKDVDGLVSVKRGCRKHFLLCWMKKK